MKEHRILHPAGWPRPRGYSNGIVAEDNQIFLAGQIGWDASGTVADGFADQVAQALRNIVKLLAEVGAEPQHITRLTWFVTDLQAYRDSVAEIGAAYRTIIGRHFPAMSVIGVSELLEPKAMVEIEATAVLPR